MNQVAGNRLPISADREHVSQQSSNAAHGSKEPTRMKNRAESVSTSIQERFGPLRKLVAIGALATVALTGCASNTEAKPEPTKTEQVAEEPVETEAPIEHPASTVPKIRESWTLNNEALGDLGWMKPDDPNYSATRAEVCGELFANNPLGIDFEPSLLNRAEEVHALHEALIEFNRQYLNDEYRDRVWLDEDPKGDVSDEYSGIEACTLGKNQAGGRYKDLINEELMNDKPLPKITTEAIEQPSLKTMMQDGNKRIWYGNVAVEGEEPRTVWRRYLWNEEAPFKWELQFEQAENPFNGGWEGNSYDGI